MWAPQSYILHLQLWKSKLPATLHLEPYKVHGCVFYRCQFCRSRLAEASAAFNLVSCCVQRFRRTNPQEPSCNPCYS